ncbi:MAG TPA: nitroreductase family protein [Polyangiales bacterium]|nr:nitroreductase family protein [Polyangiales bacterium]
MAEHELYEVMQTTRAVRRLRPDPIPDAVLQRVLAAATWGPSGGNRQPWRAIVLREPTAKQTLQELYLTLWTKYAAGNREKFKGLPPALLERAEKNLTAGDYLAAHLAQAPVILVFCFDPGLLAITDAKLNRPSVVGGGSIYPAVQNVLLACCAEGLGCVLTTLLCAEEPKIRPLLGIPEPWCTAAFVPIGYPVGRGHGPLTRRPVEEMVFGDRWGRPLAAE